LVVVIPADSPWEKGLNEYIKYVQEKSAGNIQIKTYLGEIKTREVTIELRKREEGQ